MSRMILDEDETILVELEWVLSTFKRKTEVVSKEYYNKYVRNLSKAETILVELGFDST